MYESRKHAYFNQNLTLPDSMHQRCTETPKGFHIYYKIQAIHVKNPFLALGLYKNHLVSLSLFELLLSVSSALVAPSPI